MQVTRLNMALAMATLLLASCTEVTPGEASTPASNCPSPDVMEHAATILEAASKLENASSYLATTTWTNETESLSGTLSFVAPDRFDHKDTASRLIVIGNKSYQWLGDMGPVEAPLDPQMMLLLDQTRLLILGAGISSATPIESRKGEFPSARQFRVAFCPNERFEIRDDVDIWVDTDGNPVARRITGTIDGRQFRSEVRYSRLNDSSLRIEPPPAP